ncbi:MAG TPA: hypothetical protein ACFYD3_05915 [Candidatus Hypogeohydataceae bacterium YC41]
MICRQVEKEMINYYYNELDSATKSAISDHISGCLRCQSAWKDLKATLDSIEGPIPTTKILQGDYLAGVYKKIKGKQRRRLLVTLVSAITPFVLVVSLGVTAYIIKTKIETSLAIQDLELVEHLDLVQDMEIIQGLGESETVPEEEVRQGEST